MEENKYYDDIANNEGNPSARIIKSGFLSKRSKYLKIWKKYLKFKQ
jgi:hypothetical protein